MVERRKVIKEFKEWMDQGNIKHITYNYTESDVGVRNPNSPCGFIVRQQFQAEAYAGRAKSIWSGEGMSVHWADWFTVLSNNINLVFSDIKNLRFNGKHFNPDLWEWQNALTLKKGASLDNLGLVGPQTKVVNNDGSEGVIVNSVPLNSIVEAKRIWDDNSETSLLPRDVEIYNLVKSVMGF